MVVSFSFIADSLMELLSPALCALCENTLYSPIERNQGFCEDCLLHLTPPPTSDKVLASMLNHIDADDIAISDIYGLTEYHHDLPIHNAVYDFKYHGIYNSAFVLGKKLGEIIKEQSFIQYSSIIPVPIHAARKRERGYNQAEVIAKGIELILKVPISREVLYRTKYTPSQTTLSSKERLANVSGLFKSFAQKTSFFDKNVLLIDDIFTTGATVNNCAKILLEQGARRVDVAVIGIAGIS